MKNLQDYMDLPYELLLIPDPEDGFAACYPELPGCLTVGETKAEAAAQAESAKQEWIGRRADNSRTQIAKGEVIYVQNF